VVEVNVEACPPDSLTRLLNPKLKKSERVEAYIQIFFFPTHKPEIIMESTQRYLNMLDQGMSMRRIMATMVEDRRQYVGHSAEVDTIKQRIDDLQKAKATFQKQQQEKKQRKNRKAPEPERGPACAVCGTAVELQHKICPVCEISFTYGITKEPHPYCSEKCQNGDYVGHIS
jgi:rubrerythrin